MSNSLIVDYTLFTLGPQVTLLAGDSSESLSVKDVVHELPSIIKQHNVDYIDFIVFKGDKRLDSIEDKLDFSNNVCYNIREL